MTTGTKVELVAVSTVVAGVLALAYWVRSWDFGQALQPLTDD